MTLPPPPPGSRLEIVMFSGDRIEFGRFELARALFHRYVVIHYALVCFFLPVVNTRSGLLERGISEQAIIAITSVLAAVLLLLVVVLVLDHIASRRGRLTVMVSPILFVMATCGVLAADATELLLVDGSIQRWLRTGALSSFYYIIVEAVAHVLILLVMPRVLAEFRTRPRQPEPQAIRAAEEKPVQSDVQDHVEIGRRKLKPESVVRISAEGNYLRVVTTQERMFVPGPFSAAVEGLPERVGVQLSRSEWVALPVVRRIRKEGREMFVDLQDGTSVRVANSRQKLVQSLLDMPVEDGRKLAATQGPGVMGGKDRSTQTG